MEIEAKYSILNEQTELALAELPRLAGYLLGEVETHDLHDTYLDTPDHIMIQAGYACRLRREGCRSHITLKGIRSSADVAHHREELKVAIEEDVALCPQRWPKGPVRDLVLDLSKGDKLVELFDVRQLRRSRYLTAEDERVAELSVDSVSIEGPSRTQRFTELEVELLESGSEADLARIIHELSDLPGLSPQPTSKFERGYALTYRRTGKGAALQLGNVAIDDTMAEAMRKILRPHFLRMLLHEHGTCLGEDPEELHDMRVATRRMRTALRVGCPYLNAPALRKIRDDLERVADVLGDVRDMDVFHQKVERYIVKKSLDPAAFTPLAQIWNVEYARRRNKMLDCLTSRRYNDFKRSFWSRLEDELPHSTETVYVRDVLPAIVREQLTEFREDAANLEDTTMTLSAYHTLRISGKRLRYTLEFFRDALGPGAAKAVDTLKSLQDYLGDLQDARVAANHLWAVIEFGTWETPSQPRVLWQQATADGKAQPVAQNDALRGYLQAREGEIEDLLAGAGDLWRDINGNALPTLVDEALAAL